MDLFFNLPYILHPLLSPKNGADDDLPHPPTHLLYSQARYESQRIQMESELAVQLEQRVTERLAQAQESSLRQAASLRDHHRCLELAGCCLSTAAAGGGGGGTQTLSDPFTSFQHTGPCLSLSGRPASGSQESQTCLGIFHFPPIGRST